MSSFLTSQEIDSVQHLPRTAPYLIQNVSSSMLSVGRLYGACTFQGMDYTYMKDTDELVRNDVLRVVTSARRKHERAERELATNAFDWDKVIDNVAALFNITSSKIRGRSRPYAVALARQTCMALARSHGFTLQEIADHFDRDHGTVSYACEQVSITLTHGRLGDRVLVKKAFDDHAGPYPII